MDLADLFDLEARLASDHGKPEAALRARDRAVASKLDVNADRADLLAAWVRALRPEDEASPGERVAQARAWLTRILACLGLLAGAGAAFAAMSFDGRHPVNVARFVFVLVLPQLALLALTLTLLSLRRARARRPLLAGLWRRLAHTGVGGERTAELTALFARIDARRGLSVDVQRAVLLGTSQTFGVAFNVGALAACVSLVAFTDLHFGWSSTLLRWDGAMARMVHVLATPWRFAWPEASPTLEIVRATRFDASGVLVDRSLAGLWWPFLVASLVTYGLLPRVVTAVGAKLLERRALARVPLDTPDVDAALHRLRGHRLTAEGPAPVGPLPVARPVTLAEDALDARRWVAIAWRDFPAKEATLAPSVERALAGALGPVFAMGGGPDQTRKTLESLPDALREGDGVLVLCEAFEPPDRGLRTTLEKLRAVLGARRRLVVGMVERVREDGALAPASQGTIALWTRTLDALGDPYLKLAPLGGEA